MHVIVFETAKDRPRGPYPFQRQKPPKTTTTKVRLPITEVLPIKPKSIIAVLQNESVKDRGKMEGGEVLGVYYEDSHSTEQILVMLRKLFWVTEEISFFSLGRRTT